MDVVQKRPVYGWSFERKVNKKSSSTFSHSGAFARTQPNIKLFSDQFTLHCKLSFHVGLNWSLDLNEPMKISFIEGSGLGVRHRV